MTVVANGENVNFFAAMVTRLGAICQVGLKAAILLDPRIQPLSHKGSGYATLTFWRDRCRPDPVSTGL